MKPKLRPLAGDALANAVPNGETEMIFSSMPDILIDGTTSLGPLPTEMQSYTSFAAGVGTHAKEPEAANALMKFLTAREAIAVIKAKGMEPGSPRERMYVDTAIVERQARDGLVSTE
jgi:molybdate transport system substrate-binding protein